MSLPRCRAWRLERNFFATYLPGLGDNERTSRWGILSDTFNKLKNSRWKITRPGKVKLSSFVGSLYCSLHFIFTVIFRVPRDGVSLKAATHAESTLVGCNPTSIHQYSGTPLWRRPFYNEQQLKARQNYSEICGNKPRYNELRHNKIPSITNRFWWSQRTIYSATTNILSSVSLAVSKNDMMVQMFDKPNATPIGQDRETFTFKALL